MGPAAGGGGVVEGGGGGRRLGDVVGRKLSTTIDNIPGLPFKKETSSNGGSCSSCRLVSCWRRINRPKKFLGELFGKSVLSLFGFFYLLSHHPCRVFAIFCSSS